MNGTALLFSHAAEPVRRSHRQDLNFYRQGTSNRALMVMLGMLLLTEQMRLRNNAYTLSSIGQTVPKDVHAHQTTGAYVSLGTMMNLYIHLIYCDPRPHFASWFPCTARKLLSLSGTSLVGNFVIEGSYPEPPSDISLLRRKWPAYLPPSYADITCLTNVTHIIPVQ